MNNVIPLLQPAFLILLIGLILKLMQRMTKLSVKMSEVQAVVSHIEDRQTILKYEIEKTCDTSISELKEKQIVIDNNQKTIFKRLNKVEGE